MIKIYFSKMLNSLGVGSLLRAFIFPILVLLFVIVFNVLGQIPLPDMMRDPAAVADIPPHVGFVSNIGVLLWAATAVICFFTWRLLQGRQETGQHQSYIFWSGVLTIVLLLDDLFLLHEDIFPNELGISQKMIIVLYFGLVLSWLIVFRQAILSSDFSFLIIALLFFGLSIGVDYLDEFVERIVGHWRIFIEDGSKLLGIGSWLFYFGTLTALLLKKHLLLEKATLE